MALRGDELFLCYGVMGGFMQVRFPAPPFTSHEASPIPLRPSRKAMSKCS